MYYKVYFDFEKFDFWAGAKDRIESATEEQKALVKERIEDWLRDLEDCGQIPEETAINDLVWFDCDDIFFPEEQEQDEEQAE